MMKEFSMHILDIVQNSVRAKATEVTVVLIEDVNNNIFSFSVLDNGCGMSEEMLANIRDPFTTSRTTRKVGLGIPMLEQTCEMCGGGLELTSELGVGTKLKASMQYDNIDRPPLGEFESSIQIMVIGNPEIDFKFIYRYNENEYELDMKEVKEVLDGVSLSDPEVITWLKDNIYEGIAEARENN